jgi:lipid II:glycine glycyltransferase (peptidoglycan interpeptide bridge formation enzyme)
VHVHVRRAVRAGALRPEDGRAFVEAFAASCREQGIVAEFAHLNPWSVPDAALDAGGVEVNRDVVYVDLRWGEERIWKESFTSDARRATRRSWDAGVTVRRASTPADVREFHRLYELTMERRDALDRYRYPVEHFLALFETMPRNAWFALAEHEGRAVAGGLFLESGDDVYWHLSAADLAQAALRPVNAYVHEAVRWAARAGKHRLLLGGAYRAGDGVHRFKAGFSPLRVAFRTYQRVHDPETYRASTSAWSMHHGGREPPQGYFPAYRAA